MSRRATSSRLAIASISRVMSPMRCSNWRGKKVCKQLTHCRREIVGVIFESLRQVELEEACALPQGDPVFEAESSHLIDQTRSRSDHLISDPV